jgi:hypothetical protein
MSLIETDHSKITAAGWSYRMNGRGWVIYQHPKTRLWHTRLEALSMIAAEGSGPVSRETFAVCDADPVPLLKERAS